MSERIFNNLKELLASQNAKFRVIEHISAGASKEVAQVRGTILGQGAKALVCIVKGVSENGFESKNLIPDILKLSSDKPILRNGRIYVLAVFAADFKADLNALAKVVGGRKASLVSVDEVRELTDCVIGCVPPFSFHNSLNLIVDNSLFGRFDEIAFNAGLLNRSIILDIKDYERIAKPTVLKFANLSDN